MSVNVTSKEDEYHPKKLLVDSLLVYVSYGMRFVSPLIVTPTLARRLGPSAYGSMTIGLALASLITIIVEFGFSSSGARDIAMSGDVDARFYKVYQIYAARVILSCAALLIGLLASISMPAMRSDWRLISASIGLGIVMGFNTTWYWQGTARLRVATMLDGATIILFCLFVLEFVGKAADAWLVITFQFLSYALTVLSATIRINREVLSDHNLAPPLLHDILAELRGAFSLFMTRASTSIYTVGSVFILGFFTSVREVSYYGAAERLALILISATYPLGQLIFPHVARRVAAAAADPLRLARRTMVGTLMTCAVLAGATQIWGSAVIAMLFGPRFMPAAPTLQALIWLVPLSALNTMLSTQVFVPYRAERYVLPAILSGAFINIIMAPLLCPILGSFGMAISRTLSEATITFSLVIQLARAGLLRTLVPSRAG